MLASLFTMLAIYGLVIGMMVWLFRLISVGGPTLNRNLFRWLVVALFIVLISGVFGAFPWLRI